jgi:FixJ family two-component response regulator
MQMVQQFERTEGRQRLNSRPGQLRAAGNILAKPGFLPNKVGDLDWRRAGVAPAIERSMSSEEKNARVHNVNGYSEYCPEPRPWIALGVKGSVKTTDITGDGRSVVYVVVDDGPTRESLEALIGRAGWRCEVFASAQEFLSRPRLVEHCCLLLDFNLAAQTCLDLQKTLPDQMSEVPIVFLSRCADVRTAVQAMKRGAIDFLTKPCDDDVLVAAIQQAFERSRGAFDHVRVTQAINERRSTLSRREQEVMTLVVTGLLNKQIGFELGISEITVKAHRGQVMRKMEARSLAGLVTMAGQIGLTG